MLGRVWTMLLAGIAASIGVSANPLTDLPRTVKTLSQCPGTLVRIVRHRLLDRGLQRFTARSLPFDRSEPVHTVSINDLPYRHMKLPAQTIEIYQLHDVTVLGLRQARYLVIAREFGMIEFGFSAKHAQVGGDYPYDLTRIAEPLEEWTHRYGRMPNRHTAIGFRYVSVFGRQVKLEAPAYAMWSQLLGEASDFWSRQSDPNAAYLSFRLDPRVFYEDRESFPGQSIWARQLRATLPVERSIPLNGSF